MKSKLAWIPFIPLALIACFLKIGREFLPNGAVMGLSALKLEYLFLGCVALIFVFSVVFCLIDRKIASYYLPRRNFIAGILGLLLALLLAADGADSLFLTFSSGAINMLDLSGSILSILSAVVFVVLGLRHSFRYEEGKHFSLLNVLPALMCGVRMILSFVQFTTISIRLADVSGLICYIFATMFFFNYAIILSVIKSKNAVKNCFIFGLPAAAVMIPSGLYSLLFSFNAEQITKNLQPLSILLMGLYILTILIELSFFVRDRDSVELVLNDAPAVDVSKEKVEGFIASNQGEDDNDSDRDDSHLDARDTEGFLYQEFHAEDEEPEESEEKKNDAELYLTDISEDADEENDRPKDYESRLDEIDKLIIDINGQSD
ncbi:MAG: hypothetical protein IJH07_10915 [Ruminococcus sp.]|nr:hypothetical protein [Ruminococcus sp.]